MGMTYFRRFRMEIDFDEVNLPQPSLPDGYRWSAWQPALLSRHVTVKFKSFRDEIDSQVFPCLGDLAGCQRLMLEIIRQKCFLPAATWLISHRPRGSFRYVGCGTIQGVEHNATFGAVQNVGVVPEHRGLGLGRALVLKALHGFEESGLRRVYLEVTAHNTEAVELYRSIGFRLTRTMYKAIETEVPVGV